MKEHYRKKENVTAPTMANGPGVEQDLSVIELHTHYYKSQYVFAWSVNILIVFLIDKRVNTNSC